MTKKNGEVLSSPSYRIIDANLNRLREGIRVLEDLCRFAYNDEKNAKKLKSLRHKVRFDELDSLLDARDILGDVSKQSTKSELQRQNLEQIITANIKRAQESSRVLEEIFKTIDATQSNLFKQIRYNLYDIEKNLPKE